MADKRRDALIQGDTIIKGTILNAGAIDVYGYVEGNIAAQNLRVHEGGRIAGKLKADTAEVRGTLQGEAIVKRLIKITSTGVVEGDIRYGSISLEAGGDLSAELRNIPPEIAGDLELVVSRGQSVVVTVMDLMAIDPDHGADALTFTVTSPTGGWVAMSDAPREAVTSFKQTDIEAGRVLFVHDGSAGNRASFDVVVVDGAGAASGAAQTVKVAVLAK
ncbi:polymer-forming cytoskeletal protein [Hyphomicrobium sp. CS1BSMeth3]|uniref:polymer-forming cytoskeletal protein n=1 Tax=Hyphomicrobium sp. CS1BSMeth3 TaxID=1892844 RepID=UPI0009309EA3|nr:polymer-forming cytoskeletal protein [Hyphomicrobium sp. CS1BSMeth3]